MYLLTLDIETTSKILFVSESLEKLIEYIYSNNKEEKIEFNMYGNTFIFSIKTNHYKIKEIEKI